MMISHNQFSTHGAEALGVGDTLFRFDENRRFYDPVVKHKLIFAKHFAEEFIVGETPKSWLVSYRADCDPKSARKVAKDTLTAKAGNYRAHTYYTPEGYRRALFIEEFKRVLLDIPTSGDYELWEAISKIPEVQRFRAERDGGAGGSGAGI